MGSPYSDGWDLSKYQEMLDNLSIEGDGMKEFNEIYSLLREKFSASRSRDWRRGLHTRHYKS